MISGVAHGEIRWANLLFRATRARLHLRPSAKQYTRLRG